MRIQWGYSGDKVRIQWGYCGDTVGVKARCSGNGGSVVNA